MLLDINQKEKTKMTARVYLTNRGFKYMPEYVFENKNTMHLDLSTNQITSIPDCLTNMVSSGILDITGRITN